MGIASSSIPYDICIETNNYPDIYRWKLHDGNKRVLSDDASEDQSEVSIFSFKKKTDSQEVSLLHLVQKGCQRLKSVKHPYVLGFIESTEVEDSFLMVTERAIPLGLWLRTIRKESDSYDLEIVWGLKCIFEALHFLHSKCHIAHCNISLMSCFYTKNGDWKLGLFDLACNLSTDGDFFEANLALQDSAFRAPETVDGSWKSIHAQDNAAPTESSPGKKCGWSIDVFAMGKVLQTIYATDQASISKVPASSIMPKCLEGPLKRMLSPDHRRRPSCASLLKAPCFHADELHLMSTICELQLKPPLECIDIFTLLKEKVDLISKAVCTFKILPCVGNMLARAVADFPVRDNRETCRRIVQTALELLAQFGEQSKIDEKTFTRCCLGAFQQLWTFSDRAIRTALLRSLKSILYLLSRETVNKKLFDPLLSGFSDSNSKLREDTLKSLVDVVEKLDEAQLQDKLVRCILNLQSDAEASVRTNAVIFLSRITVRLAPAVRLRVLAGSYCKAMKDPFVHCRMAGLRAAEASMTLFDLNQVCTRLIPQIALLLLDKSSDVNQLALKVLEACTLSVRRSQEEQQLSRAAGGESAPSTPKAASASAGAGGSTPPASGGAKKSDWASWAFEGLTKSMEHATLTNDPTAHDMEVESDAAYHTTGSSTIALKAEPGSAPLELAALTKETKAGDGWADDDDLDLDELLSKDDGLQQQLSKVSKCAATSVSAADSSTERRVSRPAVPSKKLSRKDNSKAVTGVKKLSVTPDEKESWDDF